MRRSDRGAPRRMLVGRLHWPLVVLMLFRGGPALAQGAARALEELVRGTSKVARDVPLGKLDDLVEELGKSRAVREAVGSEARAAGRALEATKGTKGLSRAEEALKARGAGRALEAAKGARGLSRAEGVLSLLRKSTGHLDPSVMRRLEQLDGPSLEAALVLAKGGEQVQRSIPDIVARGRFLRAGGAETVAAIGTFGPDAAKAAMRVDAALQGGSLIVRNGGRAVTLADFGRAMTRFGDASWPFWKTYVRPHWKIWLASGALAAYLAAPETFQDAAGRLTEAGFRRLTELAGAVAAASIRGVGQGTAAAVDRVTGAVTDTFVTGARGRSAAIGTALLLLLAAGALLLLHKRIRRLWGPSRNAPGRGPTAGPKPVR